MATKLTPLVLTPLNVASPIVDVAGRPQPAFVQSFNNSISNIEAQVTSLEELITEVVAANGLVTAAQGSADTAQAAATQAQQYVATTQAQVTQTALLVALMGSFTSPQNVVTAVANGTNAVITVAPHERRYANGSVVAVAGGSITGLALSTAYSVFYSDSAHVGGTVSFGASTSRQDAAQIAGVHSCGQITTPGANGTSSGAGWAGPGLL